MPWVRIEDDMPNHPKVAKLSDAGFRAYVTAICHAAHFLTDGRVAVESLQKVRPAAVKEVLAAGLFEETEKGIAVHDFLDFNPSRDETLERRRMRAELGARGGHAKAAKRYQTASGEPARSQGLATDAASKTLANSWQKSSKSLPRSPSPSPPSPTGIPESISEGGGTRPEPPGFSGDFDGGNGKDQGPASEAALGPPRRKDATRWPAVLSVLRGRVDPRDFQTWLADSHELDEEALTVEVRSAVFVDEISRRWGFEIFEAAGGPVVLVSGDARVRLVFASGEAAPETSRPPS